MASQTAAQLRFEARTALFTVGVIGFAAVVGVTATTDLRLALVSVAVPLAFLFLTQPELAVLVALPLLPFSTFDVVGREYSGLNVSPADIAMTLAIAGSVGPALLRADVRQRLARGRTAFTLMAPFLAWVAVTAAAHFTLHTVINSLQVAQIVAIPTALGLIWMDDRLARLAIGMFVVSALILALVAVATAGHTIASHKNPWGQYLADALLIVLALSRSHRVRYFVLPPLVVGIFFSQSRGALLGVSIGAITLLAIRGLGSWRRTAGAVVPLALIVVVGYNLVPASV
jgi:hypothetical protein